VLVLQFVKLFASLQQSDWA